MRKLTVNILVSLMVLGGLAGVSAAMPGSPLSFVGGDDDEDVADDTIESEEDPEPDESDESEEPETEESDESEEPETEESDESELDESDGEDGDEGDDAFGAVRSAEAEAFGLCMDEQTAAGAKGHEAKEACLELKAGPAVTNPAHPVFGEGGKHEGKHDDKAEVETKPKVGSKAKKASSDDHKAKNGSHEKKKHEDTSDDEKKHEDTSDDEKNHEDTSDEDVETSIEPEDADDSKESDDGDSED